MFHTDHTNLTKHTRYHLCVPPECKHSAVCRQLRALLAPTRSISVGCDEGRFIFPEELLSKAKSPFREIREICVRIK